MLGVCPKEGSKVQKGQNRPKSWLCRTGPKDVESSDFPPRETGESPRDLATEWPAGPSFYLETLKS